MKRFFALFRKPWLLSFLGLLAVAAVIWFLGPLVGFAGREPLATPTHRVVLILGLMLVWGLNRLRLHLAALRKNKQMLTGLAAESAPDPAAVASAEEIATLQQRFEEALAVLKKARVEQGRQYLYQLPWYIIIGPPGSGKTTALVNSGLRFPLADRFGREAIRGVGGTRNCDWWFTDEAVLIDTAGRYTTQDSYAQVDRAAWTGFLDLLKKHRRRRPINGAVVALSIGDLMQQTEAERAVHARAVKQRIQELHQHLGIRFPIYVLLTKSDLIAGFTEFFGDLGREDRAQVWGMTFPVEDPGDPSGHFKNVMDRFGAEFDALEQALNARLLERLQEERDPERRALIYAFPQQFRSLRDTLQTFLADIFQPSRFEERALLRGVYFTSGTQEGTPIDRVMSALAATFGLARQVIGTFSGHGKSYFITRLFRDVIFQEAGLAGTNLRLERQRAWIQRAAYAGIVIVAGFAAAAWFASYIRNQHYVQEVAVRVQSLQREMASLPAAERSPVAVLPLLNEVRDIPGGYRDRGAGTPWLMGLGLYQGTKLGSGAQVLYRLLLGDALLPRIVLRLEDQLRQGAGQPDFVYEALRVYLMLDDPAHFDAQTVHTWVSLDWDHNLPRDVTAVQRGQLKGHLAALLEHRPEPLPIALDDDLIRRSRAIIMRMPFAQRVYANLKEESVAKDMADFRISEAAGPDAPLIFARKHGQPLNKGIPGLYTYAGYQKVFSQDSPRLIAKLAEESWILGKEEQLSLAPATVQKLTDEVRELYLKDYVRQWEALLADLDVRSLPNLQQAVEVLRVMSAPDSPLRRLLEAVEKETVLDRRPRDPPAQEEKGTSLTDRFRQFFKETPAPAASEGAPASRPESTVARHFEELHRLVQAPEGKPAPIESTLEVLNQLYVYLNGLASAADRGKSAVEAAKGTGNAAVTSVKLAASRQPAPVNRWLNDVADDAIAITVGGARSELNALWASEVLPFCRKAISDRYPLSRTSRQEVTLEDFGYFFGPDGLMDSFFKQQLEPFVGTGSRNALGISADALRQFQRAATIKEYFFRAAGKTPSVRFDLKPVALDAKVRQFLLDLDGQLIEYRHGPPRPARVQWPGPEGPGQVRIVFEDLQGNRPSMTEDGPWAWFRVLDQSAIDAADHPDRFRVTFSLGGYRASFELLPSSVLNPFQLQALTEFHCPERL